MALTARVFLPLLLEDAPMALPWTAKFLTLTIKAFLLYCLQSNFEARAISEDVELHPSLLLEQCKTGQK